MNIVAYIHGGEAVLIAILGLVLGMAAGICGLVHRRMFYPWVLPLLLGNYAMLPDIPGTVRSYGWRGFACIAAAVAGWNAPTVAAWWAACWSRRWQIRNARGQLGQCPHCGYDLTGNTSGTCSECGKPCEGLR